MKGFQILRATEAQACCRDIREEAKRNQTRGLIGGSLEQRVGQIDQACRHRP
jgi:hypothetical protein